MSVSSTSRVSSSSSPVKRTERHYGVGAEGNSFVEVIDTTNNVLVRDDNDNQHSQQQNYKQPQQEDSKNTIASDQAHVSSGAIEALSASGVYDATEETGRHVHRQVNIYDNNMAITRSENETPADNPYLKHLYEKNQILEEVDKLI